MSEKGKNVRLEESVQQAVKSVLVKPAAAARQMEGKQDSTTRVARIRERHHAIARMVAAGVPDERICKVTGITPTTLDLLRDQTPAFIELIEWYRPKSESQRLVIEEFTDLMESNMIASAFLIRDRLLEEPDKVSISEALRIQADGADRLGYSKHSVNLNVNLTLAERLDSMRRRTQAPAGAGDGGVALSEVSPPPRSAAPLLELKAEPGMFSRSVMVPPEPEAGAFSHPAASPAQPSDGPMSQAEVLARHKQALENRRNTTRAEPPPITEKIRRI